MGKEKLRKKSARKPNKCVREDSYEEPQTALCCFAPLRKEKTFFFKYKCPIFCLTCIITLMPLLFYISIKYYF